VRRDGGDDDDLATRCSAACILRWQTTTTFLQIAHRATKPPEANAPGVTDSAGGREPDGAKAHQLARQVIAECEAVFALTQASSLVNASSPLTVANASVRIYRYHRLTREQQHGTAYGRN
jgi:hypothetical protein